MTDDNVRHAISTMQELWPDARDKLAPVQVEALADGIRRIDISAEQITRALQQLYRTHSYRSVPPAKAIIDALKNAENKPRQHRIPDSDIDLPKDGLPTRILVGRVSLRNKGASDQDAIVSYWCGIVGNRPLSMQAPSWRPRAVASLASDAGRIGVQSEDHIAWAAQMLGLDGDDEVMVRAREMQCRETAQGGAV